MYHALAQYDCNSIALETLQLYHSLSPPENQFFIRAHLCEAAVVGELNKPLPTLTEVP